MIYASSCNYLPNQDKIHRSIYSYARSRRIQWKLIRRRNKNTTIVQCVCLPNSSTAVKASSCCSYSSFPHSHFGHPPNMITRVCPCLLMAVVVCLNRVCVASWRVSWREGRRIVWHHSWKKHETLARIWTWAFALTNWATGASISTKDKLVYSYP